MNTFSWRPQHGGADAHSIIIRYRGSAGGDGQLLIPVDVGDVERRTVTLDSGGDVDYYVVTLPARALVEFGVRVARERVEALLRGLLASLDRPEVTS